jgi:uncharacterized Rmd1/YagE family protein
LGRFALELLNNSTASEKTAAILGWVIILVVLAVLLGLLNLEPFITAWLSKGK